MYPEPADDVAAGFFIFVKDFDNLDVLGDYLFLLDYVFAWIEHGDAIEWCAGKHGNLTSGIIVIAAMYEADPSVLDFVVWEGQTKTQTTHERRVRGLVAYDGTSVLCLDRHYWDRLVFKSMMCACPPESE